ESVNTGPEDYAFVGGHRIYGTGKRIWDLASARCARSRALSDCGNPASRNWTGRCLFRLRASPFFRHLRPCCRWQGACVDDDMPSAPRTLIADDQSDVLEALRLLL